MIHYCKQQKTQDVRVRDWVVWFSVWDETESFPQFHKMKPRPW